MHRLLYIILYAIAASASLAFVGCGQGAPPEGAAVKNRKQLPAFVDRGVSGVISDSGIMRYRFIAEEWAVYDQTQPPRQEFHKGILMLRYNDKMAINMQVTADTAVIYPNEYMELRGNVYVIDEEKQSTYTSQQLFYDFKKEEFYSNVWTSIVTPDREIQGSRFRSKKPEGNKPAYYEFDMDKGSMPMPKEGKDTLKS